MTSSPRVIIPIVAGIGNALLAAPMVRQIKRNLPDSRITILAISGAIGEVFQRLEEVDDVVVTGKGIKGLWRMVRASRRRRPDVYLIPFPSNRWQYSLLAASSGAKQRIMHGYPVGFLRAMHFLCGERWPAQRGIHDVQQNLNLLRKLGIEPQSDDRPVFAVTDQDRAEARRLLRESGADPEAAYVIVHAGSARTVIAQAKRWPSESYVSLIAALREEMNLPIVVVEGPDEAGIGGQIVSRRRGGGVHLVTLAGPLATAAALLEGARLYVGSDSGLAHLAAAVGVPPVTIFAPADPDRVCPYGYRHLVVQAPTACAPCFLYPYESPYPKMRCREPFCIRQVTVEAVLQKVRSALSQSLSSQERIRVKA